MSVTDSHTQSQTRLHNSVTELDTATAHWRRGAANAHLAANSPSAVATPITSAGLPVVRKRPTRKILYDIPNADIEYPHIVYSRTTLM